MLYSILRQIVRLICLALGLKGRGLHNMPKEGSVIVASNHVSMLDPIAVGVIINRPIHFMAKAELFKNKLLGKILKKLYVFPVRRGAADRTAIRKSMSILNQGKVLGIFPEGSRNKDGDEMEVQAGTAMIALKTSSPILPVACVGTDRAIPIGWFRPLEVRIGEPISLAEFQDRKVNSLLLAEVSELISAEINNLLQE